MRIKIEILIATLLFYIGGAFIWASFNIGVWDIDGKAIITTFWLISIALIYIIDFERSNESNES